MKKSIFSRVVSFAVAAAMAVTSCLGLAGTSDSPVALAAGTYKIKEYTPEQIMGNYGVIGLSRLDMNAHCHSNFLAKHLNAQSDSGLRTSYDPYNKTEEFYFETFENVSAQLSNDPQSGYLYIGKDVSVTKMSDGVRVSYGGVTQTINKPRPDRVTHETAADRYVDMSDIAGKMQNYNQDIVGLTATTSSVSYDFTTDQNNKHITCTGSGTHVLNISGNEFLVNQNKIDIRFNGITENDTETSLVINIDMKGITRLGLGELLLNYGNKGINNSEANATSNHNRIYYNFYDSSKSDKQYTSEIDFNGRGFGTVIAPSATVVLGQNWDGVAVGNNVKINGEFHRVVNPIGAPEFSGSDYQEETGEITLAKTKTGGTLLAGAELELEIKSIKHDLANVKVNNSSTLPSGFTVTDSNKKIKWTSGAASVKFSELPEGEYTWRETKAPTSGGNFEIAPEIRFKVGADGNVYLYTGNDDYSNTAYDTTKPVNMVDGVVVQAEFSKKAAANYFGIEQELPLSLQLHRQRQQIKT
ncbi:MAG: SpaA isopeptide-forming pilin-related protein [Clostridium sp.]|nr:SpaA isopeptide-forming pilin-related protein [Clostridium sp.]